MNQRKCKNCVYWDCGTCEKVDSYDSDDKSEKHDPIRFGIIVTVDDDSNLNIMLKTGPEFGCALFKDKN